MKNSLTETCIIKITERTINKMKNVYFYRLEDSQLRYFLNIIIANLPDLIKNLDFKKEISQFNLDKLTQNKTLELEIQEEILKEVIYSISDTIVGFVNHRSVTIMGKNIVAREFPILEGKLIKDEEGNLFWQLNE